MTDHSDEFDLPGPLRDAMQRMHSAPIVSPELDDRILLSAKDAFVRRHRMRQMVKGALAGIGASAAVLALAIWMARPGAQQPTAMTVVAKAPTPASPDDVDGDGQVNILDAYIVSRTLATHGPIDPRWDRNGDGKVDAKDVDQIAQAAVTLPATTGGLVQ